MQIYLRGSTFCAVELRLEAGNISQVCESVLRFSLSLGKRTNFTFTGRQVSPYHCYDYYIKCFPTPHPSKRLSSCKIFDVLVCFLRFGHNR